MENTAYKKLNISLQNIPNNDELLLINRINNTIPKSDMFIDWDNNKSCKNVK